MNKFSMLSLFRSARSAGTPIIGINCFDYEATVQSIYNLLKDCKIDEPIVQWDIIRGWMSRNESGKAAIEAALGNQPVDITMNPIEQLELAHKLPDDTILFMLNAHHHFELSGKPGKPEFIQALWNLRDAFKFNGRSVVLLSPNLVLPPELQQDILILDEELPSDKELEAIIRSSAVDAGIELPEEIVPFAVDALRGIAAFPAEQAVAMSISRKDGLNIDQLWERKRQLINATPALTVWNDGANFSDLGGLDELKSRLTRVIAGRRRPRVIVWIDEIEKQMAGVGSDSSGTSTDQLGVILNEMTEKDYTGFIGVGVPGSGKSAIAKAMGNECGIPTIKLDLGDAKGQFVGQSEEKIRRAMKIIEAVGGVGGAFFIATSNDISAMKPELKRRFKKGTWFFDLPSKEERDAIWKIYLDKYPEVNKNREGLDDSDWTGDEIRTCVTTAWEEDVTLLEASKSIIPVAISGSHQIKLLRTQANGAFNSTSRSGAYTMVEDNSSNSSNSVQSGGRKMKIDTV